MKKFLVNKSQSWSMKVKHIFFYFCLTSKDHLNLVSNGEESKSVGPIIISVPPPSQNSLMQENKKCLMRTKKVIWSTKVKV